MSGYWPDANYLNHIIMKKTYQNPFTEINWWVGDNLCGNLGTQYAPENGGRGGSPTSKVNTTSGS